jgi:hypothetical protein
MMLYLMLVQFVVSWWLALICYVRKIMLAEVYWWLIS